jgi:hypothetical protein
MDLSAHAEEELVGYFVAEVEARGEVEDGDGAREIKGLEGEVFKEAERHVDIGERLRPGERGRDRRSFEEVLLFSEEALHRFRRCGSAVVATVARRK